MGCNQSRIQPVNKINLTNLETTGPTTGPQTYVSLSPTAKSAGVVRKETVALQLPNDKKWGIKLHTSQSGELILYSAEPGEHGYNCGIRNGDTLHIVGKELIDDETATEALKVILLQKMRAKGETVTVTVFREILDVLLPSKESWGFQLEELEDFTLQVKQADSNGAGFKAGIRNGDCMMQVGNEILHDACKAKEAFELIGRLKEQADKEVLVIFRRPLAMPHKGKFMFREPSVRTVRDNWKRERGWKGKTVHEEHVEKQEKEKQKETVHEEVATTETEIRERKAEADLEEGKRKHKLELERKKIEAHNKLEAKRKVVHNQRSMPSGGVEI